LTNPHFTGLVFAKMDNGLYGCGIERVAHRQQR
jgi:hypothetical protein